MNILADELNPKCWYELVFWFCLHKLLFQLMFGEFLTQSTRIVSLLFLFDGQTKDCADILRFN